MDNLIRQRVNEILMGKVAMGAGDGGYGTKKGARKAVATKRRIARARLPAKRAPARKPVVRRRAITRCRAGDDGGILVGGYGTKAGAKLRADNMKAKCKIADLKAENKELKQEVKEVIREVKQLEKIVPHVSARSSKPLSYLKASCKKTGYRSAICKEMYPKRKLSVASPKQQAARAKFAAMSRAASAIMAEHKARGMPISRQEAVCMVPGVHSKNCEEVELVMPDYEPVGQVEPAAPAFELVEPSQIGQGVRAGRYRRGRGDMGYGTMIY